ncbi:MAG: glycosyltransferase [Candidatus Moranbacteria bacterium]|nr:glycosyltransferase [Candidatus Moranbacteria bacterium]
MKASKKSKVQDISVIIVTWNGGKILKNCLKSLVSNKADLKLQIIIVDNNSTDKTTQFIKTNYPEVELIENSINKGFARANNQGIKKAQADYILLLNQDIQILPGALIKLYDFLTQNKKTGNGKIASVSPQLLYPNKKLQKSLRPFPSPLNILKDAFTFGKFHENYYNHKKEQVVEQPMASCLLYRSQALKQAQGFDQAPAFFLYFNDVDLSFRIKQLGYKHYYLPQAQAIHHHGYSAKTWSEFKRLKAWSRGLYYFLVKHYAKDNLLKKSLIALEVLLIFIMRLLFSVKMAVSKSSK